VHPLLESDPPKRTPASNPTPTGEVLAWLEDPQPPPPPISTQQALLREFAEVLGWPLEDVQEAVTEIHEYDPAKREERRQWLASHPTKS